MLGVSIGAAITAQRSCGSDALSLFLGIPAQFGVQGQKWLCNDGLRAVILGANPNVVYAD